MEKSLGAKTRKKSSGKGKGVCDLLKDKEVQLEVVRHYSTSHDVGLSF